MAQDSVLKHTQNLSGVTTAPAYSREQQWLWQYAEQYPLLKAYLAQHESSIIPGWVIQTIDFMQANCMHELSYHYLQELYFHAPDNTALAFKLAEVIDQHNPLDFDVTKQKEMLLTLYKVILATAMAADNTAEIKKAQEHYCICLFKYSATVDELIHSIPIIIKAVNNNQELLQLDLLKSYYQKLIGAFSPAELVGEKKASYSYERVVRELKAYQENRRDFGEGIGVEMQDRSLPPKKSYQELRYLLLEHELSGLGF